MMQRAAGHRWPLAAVVALLFAAPCEGAEWKIGDAVTIAEGGQVAQPQGAVGDGIYLLVWRRGYDGWNGTADIVGQRIDVKTLKPLDAEPLAICITEDVQDAPQIAYVEGRFLVVWQDFRSGKQYDIRGALLDAKSGRTVQRDFLIAGGDGNQVHPAVSPAGNGFVVAWQDWRGEGRYGISARTVSPDGQPRGERTIAITDLGARPAVCRHGDGMLVTWTTGNYRGRTEGALLLADGSTKSLGALLTACAETPAVASDAGGISMVVASRTPYPDPWGWGGPGAVTCARVSAAGEPLDQKRDYGYRMTHLSERSVPNVVDAASWGSKPNSKWEAGAVGGFPGTHDGLWPRGMASVAAVGDGEFLFAWVKARLGSDRLTLSQYDIWMRSLDEKLTERIPAQQVAARPDAEEIRPVLIAGGNGKILLVYEEHSSAGRKIVARRLSR